MATLKPITDKIRALATELKVASCFVNVRDNLANTATETANALDALQLDTTTTINNITANNQADLQRMVDVATVDIINEVGTVNANAEVLGARTDVLGFTNPLIGLRIDKIETDVFDARLGVDGVENVSFAERMDSMQAQINETTSLATVFDKLRKTKTLLNIACLGDSLTYGHDIVSSDKRPPTTTPTDNGTLHIRDRAGITYPEFLQTCLREVYGTSKVNVRNMGFSGDTTKTAYEHWNKSDSDVVLMMFGTNDSTYQTIKEFIRYYRLLIERELKNGTAVILLTPPKTKDSASVGIDVYAQAVKTLASENNLPLIDMIELTSNIDASLYSDAAHFNTDGYKFIGARLSSLFIGKGVTNENRVYSGDSLSSRTMVDSFHLIGGTRVNNANYPTVTEYIETQGTAYYPDDEPIYYSFYTAQDNMIVYPSFYSSMTITEVNATLDFGVVPQIITNNLRVNHNSFKASKVFPNTTSIKYADANATSLGGIFSYDRENTIDFEKGLFIAKKGWHTVKIESVGKITFYSLDFVSLTDMRLKLQTGVYTTKTHNEHTETTVVTQTKIKIENLEQNLGYNFKKILFWENPILKVVINNWNGTSKVYAIQWNNRNTNISFLFKEIDSIVFSSVPEMRTLSSVDYLSSTDEIVLNWSGATNRATQISVSIL